MVTARDVADPYANVLRRVLPPGPGVCEVCWTASGDYPHCYACEQGRSVFGVGAVDLLVPIALAVKREQLAHELWHYKNSPRPEVQKRFVIGLTSVLWTFIAAHERCVAAAAGVAAFDAVTVVPSTTPRDTPISLADMVGRLIQPTASRYRDLLDVDTGAARDKHTLRTDRFTPKEVLSGARVLLIDDTWTRGAPMQAASYALKQAGATTVAGIVIGRHFDREFGDCEAYYQHSKRLGFSWDDCCVH